MLESSAVRRRIGVLVVALWVAACGGTGTAADRGEMRFSRRGTMPAGASWEGKWTTTFGSVDVFKMNGADGFDYAGAYLYKSGGRRVNGIFGGRMEGNRFVLRWTEQRKGGQVTGFAVWAMEKDGASFVGSWGKGDSADNGGRWEGRRDDPNRPSVPLPRY